MAVIVTRDGWTIGNETVAGHLDPAKRRSDPPVRHHVRPKVTSSRTGESDLHFRPTFPTYVSDLRFQLGWRRSIRPAPMAPSTPHAVQSAVGLRSKMNVPAVGPMTIPKDHIIITRPR